MSEHAQRFIQHLLRLNGQRLNGLDAEVTNDLPDKGGLARLRRSLTLDPGTDTKVFPYVEPFLARELHFRDAGRQAHYVVAGLYALNPVQCDQPFAVSLANLARKRHRQGGSAEGIESRFIALLGAQPDSLAQYLRQLVTLLRVDGDGYDHVALLNDLCVWMNPFADSSRHDRVRQRWARQFYQFFVSAEDDPANSLAVVGTESSQEGSTAS